MMKYKFPWVAKPRVGKFCFTRKLAAYGGHCSPFGGEGAQIVTFPVCLFILLLYQISFIALVKNDIGLYVWRTKKHVWWTNKLLPYGYEVKEMWQTNKHLCRTNKHIPYGYEVKEMWRTNKHLWRTNKHILYSKKGFKNIFCLKSCSNSFFGTPWVMTDP